MSEEEQQKLDKLMQTTKFTFRTYLWMYVAENVPLIFAQDVELYSARVSACSYVT